MCASATSHGGGLADDHRIRAGQVDAEPRDHVERTETGRLLVVAQENMNRPLKRSLLEFRDHRQRDGAEALHVDRAPPVEALAVATQRERVGTPVLPLDRHHVGVAGEDDAAGGHRPDRRKDCGLVAGRVGRAGEGDALLAQIRFDKVDEGKVRPGAFGVESHEPRRHVDRAVEGVHQFSVGWDMGLSSEKAGISTSKLAPSSVTIL